MIDDVGCSAKYVNLEVRRNIGTGGLNQFLSHSNVYISYDHFKRVCMGKKLIVNVESTNLVLEKISCKFGYNIILKNFDTSKKLIF